VAFILSFFTSVVGLSRSRSLGIYFDLGRDCLYQKKASNVVCLLQYRDGHWLADLERDQKAESDLLSVYATRYTEPPEETDQEIGVLLQWAQNDWSSLSQPERAARASQAKDGPRALPTPESTPEPTTQQDPEPESEPESEPEQDAVQMQRG
jgi:hypothetical protein